MPLPLLKQAVETSTKLENIVLKGFHFHVGSQLFDNTSHLLATEIVLNIIKEMKEELGFITEELDLGGGFGIYYKKGDAFL